MPVFELRIDKTKLKSDSKEAVKVVSDIGTQADKTKKSVDNIGKSNMNTLNKSIDSTIAKLAALYASFKSLQVLMGYVNNGFRVSSSIEDAQISMASILSATNNIADAQGNMYKGQEKFAKALGISQGLTKEIQVLALETSATFESIVGSVGGMIAPATAAGLAVEDIPAFAVKATQAMNAMQIPVQQMRTEMEAIFTGNINKAQDILATNLGITGEMVRQWKEQGILVDMLNQKLEAFAYSGEAIANTWSGLTSNVQDAYDYISSQTGRGLFEGAKQSYRELLDLLINTEGELGVGEDIENIVQMIEDLQNYIGNQLLDVTRDFIGYIKELNKPENLNELKQDFIDVWTGAVDVANVLTTIGGYILGISKDAYNAWSNLPDPIKEYGLFVSILGGKKGLVALGGASLLVDSLTNSYKGFQAVIAGDIGFTDYATANADELSALLAEVDKQTKETVQAVEDSKSIIEKSANTPKDFTRSEPEKLNISRTKTEIIDKDKLEAQAEAVRQLEEELNKLTMTDQEFKAYQFNEKMKELEALLPNQAELLRQVREAQQAAWDKEALEDYNDTQERNFEAQLSFYEKFAEETGNSTRLIELQNQAIDEQVALWRSLEIPEEFITELEKIMREDLSKNPVEVVQKSVQEYFDNATDWATNFGNVYTSAMGEMTTALNEWVWGAEVSFEEVAISFGKMVTQMIIQAAAAQVVMGVLGVFGLGGGTGIGIGTSMPTMANVAHTGGMIGDVKGRRLVSSSTFDNAPRYHNGYNPTTEQPAILLKNERVLNPQETYAYNAGMKASGESGGLSGVTVNQTINVNASGGLGQGGEVSETDYVALQKQMKTMVKSAVYEVIAPEMRKGGMLSHG